MDQLKPEERLDPERVIEDIETAGRQAFYETGVNEIIARLKPLAKEGDVVVILSNGGFGGIHDRLLKEL
jgi:UDP-N-acetylmuramate: L-alanyl-gamma-D-glutamyl-meso-diaminopimelate ligase